MARNKKEKRIRIKRSIRSKMSGNSLSPRLSVFRSNDHIYAQLIDDTSGHTIVAASSIEKIIASEKVKKVEQAKIVGKFLAEKAISQGISVIKFDRNGYRYHGRVKSLADAAREGGLKF